ncbi:hypothetical protein ACFL55_00450 [Candidatus Latescibacterota bacterium]
MRGRQDVPPFESSGYPWEFIDRDDVLISIFGLATALCAGDTDSPLIDTAALFDRQKRSRSAFFEDTCHLSIQGHKLVGTFLAVELVRLGLVP